MATRKKYTREFEQDAVRLVTEQGYNQSEAARNPGMDRGMPGRWVKEFQEDIVMRRATGYPVLYHPSEVADQVNERVAPHT